jgi:hypothetical protein
MGLWSWQQRDSDPEAIVDLCTERVKRIPGKQEKSCAARSTSARKPRSAQWAHRTVSFEPEKGPVADLAEVRLSCLADGGARLGKTTDELRPHVLETAEQIMDSSLTHQRQVNWWVVIDVVLVGVKIGDKLPLVLTIFVLSQEVGSRRRGSVVGHTYSRIGAHCLGVYGRLIVHLTWPTKWFGGGIASGRTPFGLWPFCSQPKKSDTSAFLWFRYCVISENSLSIGHRADMVRGRRFHLPARLLSRVRERRTPTYRTDSFSIAVADIAVVRERERGNRSATSGAPDLQAPMDALNCRRSL